MKMKHNNLFILVLAAATLSSCVKEVSLIQPESELIPLNISSSINQKHTKATAEGFVDKDALGLFAVNYTENNTAAGTLLAEGNQADNVKYVFDEPNHKWNPVKAVYYKDVNTHADLYAYYPYQSGIKDVNAANFEVKKDQSTEATATALSGYEASDFLWGKATDVTPVQSAIAIALSHKLSAVEVNLVEGTGFAEDEFASLEKSVILTSTTRKATINYATGEATPLGGPQFDGIVMCPQEGGSWRAIVIPQTVAAGTQLFAITVNGISYKFSQGNVTEYQAGKQMTVDITVNKKTPAGDFEFVLGDTQITDWVEDRNTHGGEARQYFVVNVTEPGTLGATIKAMGKNPDKIKNLKLTGLISKKDFYFMRDSMEVLEAVNSMETNVDDKSIPDNAFKSKKSLRYFVYPQGIVKIGTSAFYETKLSSALIIPNSVTIIGSQAFDRCNLIPSLTLPSNLITIGSSAFGDCTGICNDIIFPSSLQEIGLRAFRNCSNMTGQLKFPETIQSIGEEAFSGCSALSGNLVIPDSISEIKNSTFKNTTLGGTLTLPSTIKSIGSEAFSGAGIHGELILPDGITEISGGAFNSNSITSIAKWPSSLLEIGHRAFYYCKALIGDLILPEGLVSIGDEAFGYCEHITSIELPSTITHIGDCAFEYDYAISKVICKAVEIPLLVKSAFVGVPKDNFTVEVPPQSVTSYQTANVWCDFKRISSHYDFSISRRLMRGLNAGKSRELILRCPSGLDWNVQSKPDWVTVEPDHGTGKTMVRITFDKMNRTDEPMMNLDNIYEQIGVGRNGEVIFSLNEKDYTTTLSVEQYDSDFQDGGLVEIQKATKGDGIDIIFVGDGYDARDIATGVFTKENTGDVNRGQAAFFGIEPYSTYKDYFNVYAVISESDESGIGSENTVVDTKFGLYLTSDRIKFTGDDANNCFSWVRQAKNDVEFSTSLIIMLMNISEYDGVTMMYGDGSAIACCPVSNRAYPYDFRGIIQHEAGGHGFGKLGDEYIYHNAFVQQCGCDCCDHPINENDIQSSYGKMKSLGWYKNLSMSGDPNIVHWSHLIFHPDYSDYVDMYEGAYMHSRGVFRSEAISCMNINIPYYSAISRQAIVERIMEYAGETFTLEKFYALDSREPGATKSSPVISTQYGVDINSFRGPEHSSVVYMGEHPVIND